MTPLPIPLPDQLPLPMSPGALKALLLGLRGLRVDPGSGPETLRHPGGDVLQRHPGGPGGGLPEGGLPDAERLGPGLCASKSDTDLARGEAILRSQCLACHTRDGYRSLKALTAGNSGEDNVALVPGLRERDPVLNPYLDFIPPFAGTGPEAALVGKYLSSFKGK